jgi:hypothetical protein
MSRRQMLSTIVYVPEPKPKKIEPRKSRVQMRAAGLVEDADDVEGTYQPIMPGQSTPMGAKPPLDHFSPIEGSERKPQRTPGLLSEGILKVLLLAQESN